MEAHSDLSPATGPAAQIANAAVNYGTQFNHPPYTEMITAAIVAMKEKDGSSRQAISRYIESVYKNLSPSHAAFLTQQLRIMKNQGQLVMNKHSYMLPGSGIPLSPVPISVGTKRRPGRPPKIQSNGGGVGSVASPEVPASVSGHAAVNAPFDPIGAVPTVVPIGQVDGGTPFKRRPGRPPKLHRVPIEAQPIAMAEPGAGVKPFSTGRRPGRPTKVNNGMVVVGAGESILGKRGRGRPVKRFDPSDFVGRGGGKKKGRGRPPKMKAVGLVMGQRPVGRPRKGTVSKPRGRPRKNMAVNSSGAGIGGAAFVPVVGMGGASRPPKMAVRRYPRNLSGKPLGRPRKDASAFEASNYQDLKGRVEHFQSRVKHAVDVVKPYLNNQVAPIAVEVLQEVEALALMDMSAPVSRGAMTGESAGPSAALSSDQGGLGSDPGAPFPVQGSEPLNLN